MNTALVARGRRTRAWNERGGLRPESRVGRQRWLPLLARVPLPVKTTLLSQLGKMARNEIARIMGGRTIYLPLFFADDTYDCITRFPPDAKPDFDAAYALALSLFEGKTCSKSSS